ncbi:MAG: hypothetical protein KG003_04650 [Bacteroidetes bacterium]|nr:hypothetical protein [Bacteroidota bacterium]
MFMNKCFAIPILAILFAGCSGGPDKHAPKPYKFNRDRLDSLVRSNAAIHDVEKRTDGTLKNETYYLGDSVKYRLLYNEKSKLTTVLKYDVHGTQIWYETYFPNGQRSGHYTTTDSLSKANAYEHGYYETYYEDGKIKEIGEYREGRPLWHLPFDIEGQAGDTLKIEWVDREQPANNDSSPPKKDKVKVEKIESVTTPN